MQARLRAPAPVSKTGGCARTLACPILNSTIPGKVLAVGVGIIINLDVIDLDVIDLDVIDLGIIDLVIIDVAESYTKKSSLYAYTVNDYHSPRVKRELDLHPSSHHTVY